MDKLFSFLGALLLITAALLLCFETVAYDADYYMALQSETHSAEDTGLDEEGLQDVNELLIAYLQGKADSLDIARPVYGIEESVFNAREKAHMADVRRLFDLERVVRSVALAGGLACVLLAALPGRREKERLRTCARAALLAFLAIALAIGAFAAYALIDFNAAFLFFHSLAFDNDLWLLDPRTDLLIRMLPEAFFSNMAGKIACRMGGCFLLMLLPCAIAAFWPLSKRRA